MREIDDRYPEYARPFEPLRRRTIRARLTGNEAALYQRRLSRMNQMRKYFTTSVVTLITILILINLPEPPVIDPLPPPEETPIVLPTPTPAPPPSPLPSPVPSTTPVESPTPAPSPLPSPDPMPTPTPTPPPAPTLTPTPVPTQKPPAPPAPTPTPTPKPPAPTPTPTPTPTPMPTPTPTPAPLVKPLFTELDIEHREEFGLDGIGGYDIFAVSFSLDLHDADPAKPITARLQAGSSAGGAWEDAPTGGNGIPTLSYSGSGGVWSGELAYDAQLVEIDWDHGETGFLKQLRIACDYTLTDGTAGTAYSTDIRDLYAYGGNYLSDNPDAEGFSGTLSGKGLSVSFRLQKELILDADKLKKTRVVVYVGETWIEMEPEKLTMSPMAEDGSIQLSCPLSAILQPGESLQAGGYDEVLLVLDYKDEDKRIDWSDGTWARIRVRNTPTVEVNPKLIGPYAEEAWYPTMQFLMTLRDLKGGSATATPYVDTGDGFHPAVPPDAGEWGPVYDPAEEPGDEWSGYAAVYLPEPDTGGIRGMAKIVFDLVYPDGETERIETEPMPVYMGFFARIDESYGGQGRVEGQRLDPDSGETLYTMSFDLILDTALIDPARVTDKGGSLWYTDPGWTVYSDPETEIQTDGSGITHMRYTFVSASPFPEGRYTVFPETVGWVDNYNLWEAWSLSMTFYK